MNLTGIIRVIPSVPHCPIIIRGTKDLILALDREALSIALTQNSKGDHQFDQCNNIRVGMYLHHCRPMKTMRIL